MKGIEYLKEKNELVDIVHCAFNDWDDYNEECYESGISPQEDVEDFVADAVLNAGYRKQEWISVEERLPTKQCEVLVYYGFDRGDGDLGMMFTAVLTYFAYDKKPHFQHEETGLRVTHWMPLPDAPKGE